MIPWRKRWQPTPVFLPGKSHGQRRLAGYSPWGRKRVGHDLVTKWHNVNYLGILVCRNIIRWIWNTLSVLYLLLKILGVNTYLIIKQPCNPKQFGTAFPNTFLGISSAGWEILGQGRGKHFCLWLWWDGLQPFDGCSNKEWSQSLVFKQEVKMKAKRMSGW